MSASAAPLPPALPPFLPPPPTPCHPPPPRPTGATVTNKQGVDVVMIVVGMQGRWNAEETRERRDFVERLAKTCGKFSEADISTRYVDR